MRSITCRPATAMIRTWVARSATASSAAVSTRTSPPPVGTADLVAGAAAGSGEAGAGAGAGFTSGTGSGSGGGAASIVSGSGLGLGSGRGISGLGAGSGCAAGSAAEAWSSPTSSASIGGSSPRETDSTSDVSSSTTRVSRGIMPGRAAWSTSSAAWQSSARAPIRIMRPAPFSVCSSRLASTTDCGSTSSRGTLDASRSRRSRASSTKRGMRSANSASKASPPSDLGPTVDVDVQAEHPFELIPLVDRRGGGEDRLAGEQRVEERRQDRLSLLGRRLVPGALREPLAGAPGPRPLAVAHDLAVHHQRRLPPPAVVEVEALHEPLAVHQVLQKPLDRLPVAQPAPYLGGPDLGRVLERMGGFEVERLREHLDHQPQAVQPVGRLGEVLEAVRHPLHHLADLLQGEHDLVRGGVLLLGGERDLARHPGGIAGGAAQVLDG